MADPAAVGRKLAKKIRNTGPVVAPDFATAIGVRVNRVFPEGMGRMLARLTQRARQESQMHEASMM